MTYMNVLIGENKNLKVIYVTVTRRNYTTAPYDNKKIYMQNRKMLPKALTNA